MVLDRTKFDNNYLNVHNYIVNDDGTTLTRNLLVGKDGINAATVANPVPTDAVVTVDSMSITAEMSEATGHDYYVTTTNLGNATLTIGFDSVAGLVLEDIIKIENKTNSWIYVTKGATVTATSIALVAANQTTGYPVCSATDEFEIVYRGTSRFTDKTQMTNITDGTTELDILVQDSAFGTTSTGLGVFGKYEATPTTYTDGDAAPILLDANGRIVLSSDIEIGAVELKDASTNVRANIDAANTARTIATNVLATQVIDEAGVVLKTSSIETDTGVIAGDTTSIDAKIAALGTAAMVASSPITIASDDTLTTAANTLLGTIDTDTSAMVVDLAAIEILNTDIKTATEASAVDLAAIEVLNTTIASDTTSIDTKLTDASQKSQIIDGSGNVIASTANALDVNLASSIGLTISATDLDIRDLVSTSDSVEVLQSTASSLNMTEASASGIKIDSGVIAGDTTSLDTKEGTTGEVADAEGTRAAQLRYIGEAVDALKAPITTVTTLVTEQDLTDTYADFGAELDMSGYTKLGIWVSTDCNDSEDVDLKVLGKHTSAGADEFAIDGVSVKRLWTGVGTDSKTYYEFAIGAIPYIQLQAIAGTLGVTAGDLTISITKVY